MTAASPTRARSAPPATSANENCNARPTQGSTSWRTTTAWANYIHFGKSGELASNHREEQELSMLCLQIHQSSLGIINTLMIRDNPAEPEWADTPDEADRRGITPLFSSNMTH
ncbi:MAG: Tn3 family transposase [Candidatus Nanopelagicales bacterium]